MGALSNGHLHGVLVQEMIPGSFVCFFGLHVRTTFRRLTMCSIFTLLFLSALPALGYGRQSSKNSLGAITSNYFIQTWRAPVKELPIYECQGRCPREPRRPVPRLRPDVDIIWSMLGKWIRCLQPRSEAKMRVGRYDAIGFVSPIHCLTNLYRSVLGGSCRLCFQFWYSNKSPGRQILYVSFPLGLSSLALISRL
jgi:hypothetical protein